MAMNSEQKNHLERVQLYFKKEHTDKFIKGVLEHKTQLHKDFSATQVNEFSIEEMLDLASYLYTNRELIKKLEDRVKELEAERNRCLAYCQAQNGLPFCKNCGLGQ